MSGQNIDDDELALRELVRTVREDPDDEQVRRLERRLDPWFGAAGSRSVVHRVAGEGDARRKVALKLSIVVVALCSMTLFRDVEYRAQGVVAPIDLPSAGQLLPSGGMQAPVLLREPSGSVSIDALEPVKVPPRPSANEESVHVPSGQAVGKTKSPQLPAVIRSPKLDERAAAAPPRDELSTETANASPQARKGSATEAPRSEESATREESEVSYLRRAQQALKSDPARSLASADAHPSRFPRGILIQEREAIAIDALARLGRMKDARARFEAFRSRFPNSAHLSHVTSLFGEQP